MTFKIANKTLREFQNGDVLTLEDYPKIGDLPKEYQEGEAEGCQIADLLLYEGGKLEDYGRKLKDGVDSVLFYRTFTLLEAPLNTNVPKRLREATCGLLIDTYTEDL